MDPFYRGEENEVLEALTVGDVRFVVIGGAAVQFHGHERSRDDLDILIEPTATNAERLASAIARWRPMSPDDVARAAQPKLQFGLPPPRYIHFLTSLPNMDFREVLAEAHMVRVGDIVVPVMSFNHLITNKQSRREAKDLDDVDALLKLRPSQHLGLRAPETGID